MLIAITFGLGAFGLVGAIFAVPTVALLKVLLETYLLRRPAYTYSEKEEVGVIRAFPAPEDEPEVEV